ncbi:GATA transcription factor 15-like [Alnus glutinosa]|uniref:GATA transcription factor 15-like n=1 Tax=Alnus glutinosa TaxID=3517 RepID=UPI002D795DE6|nr:GATA transcription factor 15-like [Alnus glutinosa]
MDLTEKESLCVGMMSENKKCCSDCKTTKTPLWRGGPAGPKSLCNACGIRYRKRRVSMVGFSNVSWRKRDRSQGHGTTATTAATTSSTAKADGDGDGDRDLSESLKTKLMALGKDLLLQRSPSVMKKQRCQRRRKLKEEEQAAVCLMALSCDSVFA